MAAAIVSTKAGWKLAFLVVVLTAASSLAGGAGAAVAAEPGQARIVSVDTGTELTRGDRSTQFTLALPGAAACSGDSANDGYRVQSFQIPLGVDPGSLSFGETGPQPIGFGATFRQPLYQINGNPYVNAQTAPATPPPGPGTVINVPAFDFSLYRPDMIEPGDYEIGIACTRGVARMETFWRASIRWAADGSWTTRTTTAATTASSASDGVAVPSSASRQGVPTRSRESDAVTGSPERGRDAGSADRSGAAPTMSLSLPVGEQTLPNSGALRLMLAAVVTVLARVVFLVVVSARRRAFALGSPS